jgi:hypothetical protein
MFLTTEYRGRPPLWSSGQSSWIHSQRSGLDSQRYQIFWEVVGLERGPLGLVNTIEVILERKSNGSGLENRDYGRRWSRRADYATPLYPQKLALISSTSGGRSVGMVRSRTQAPEYVCFCCLNTEDSDTFASGVGHEIVKFKRKVW